MPFNPIDLNTVKFIGMLNELAEHTKEGFVPFSECDSWDQPWTQIVFDESNGRVVMDACIDELHHDIVSYYDDYVEGAMRTYCVEVVTDDDDNLLVQISFEQSVYGTNDIIVISDGEWYFL